MLKNKHFFKYLLILSLGLSLLWGCQPKNQTDGGTTRVNTEEINQLENDWQQLNEKYSNVEFSIINFGKQTSQIPELLDNKKLRKQADIKTDEPIRKLKELSQLIENLKDNSNFPNNAKPKLEKISKIFDTINNSKVIQLAKGGLTESVVKDIQREYKISPESGYWNNITQEKTSKFLNTQLRELKQAIDDVKVTTSAGNLNQSQNQPANQMEQRISQLEQRISQLEKDSVRQKTELDKQINQQLSGIKTSIFLVALFSIAALLASLHKFLARMPASANQVNRLPEEQSNARQTEGNYVTHEELPDIINKHRLQNNPQVSHERSQQYDTREELINRVEQTLAQNNNQIYSQFSALEKEVRQLDNNLTSRVEQILAQNNNQIYSQFSALDSKLRQLENNLPAHQLPNQLSTQVPPSRTLTSSNPPSSSAERTGHNSNLVDIYNSNPNYLPQDALEVSQTQDSIQNRRAGYSLAPIVERVNRGRGTCWVVNSNGMNYLLPKKNLKLTEHIYNTIEVLFICNNYKSGVSSEFRLIKPAKISPLVQDESWELTEPGELQFE